MPYRLPDACLLALMANPELEKDGFIHGEIANSSSFELFDCIMSSLATTRFSGIVIYIYLMPPPYNLQLISAMS